MMESTIGLFKTELIKPRRPWKTLSQVELATAEWIDWYCHRRLHGEIGHAPRRVRDPLLHGTHETPGHRNNLRSLPNPGRFRSTAPRSPPWPGCRSPAPARPCGSSGTDAPWPPPRPSPPGGPGGYSTPPFARRHIRWSYPTPSRSAASLNDHYAQSTTNCFSGSGEVQPAPSAPVRPECDAETLTWRDTTTCADSAACSRSSVRSTPR
ncbi:integrase core domain-containing protein [Streptomyces sp. CNQ085]|nr:integrase core domain-containing protein [Streptomyces sp. CNQ085]